MTGKRPSERTCVACRTQRSRAELLALRASGGVVALDRPDAGRGAYVCISRTCINALSNRAVSRAFKGPVKLYGADGNGESILAQAHALAQRRVLESLGLARRQGLLETGTDRVFAGPADGATVVATDLAERSQRRATKVAAVPFLTSEEIGQAVGMGRVGAARIPRGRLAEQAGYWLAVWRETEPKHGRGGRGRADELDAGAAADAPGATARDAQNARGA